MNLRFLLILTIAIGCRQRGNELANSKEESTVNDCKFVGEVPREIRSLPNLFFDAKWVVDSTKTRPKEVAINEAARLIKDNKAFSALKLLNAKIFAQPNLMISTKRFADLKITEKEFISSFDAANLLIASEFEKLQTSYENLSLKAAARFGSFKDFSEERYLDFAQKYLHSDTAIGATVNLMYYYANIFQLKKAASAARLLTIRNRLQDVGNPSLLIAALITERVGAVSLAKKFVAELVSRRVSEIKTERTRVDIKDLQEHLAKYPKDLSHIYRPCSKLQKFPNLFPESPKQSYFYSGDYEHSAGLHQIFYQNGTVKTKVIDGDHKIEKREGNFLITKSKKSRERKLFRVDGTKITETAKAKIAHGVTLLSGEAKIVGVLRFDTQILKLQLTSIQANKSFTDSAPFPMSSINYDKITYRDAGLSSKGIFYGIEQYGSIIGQASKIPTVGIVAYTFVGKKIKMYEAEIKPQVDIVEGSIFHLLLQSGELLVSVADTVKGRIHLYQIKFDRRFNKLTTTRILNEKMKEPTKRVDLRETENFIFLNASGSVFKIDKRTKKQIVKLGFLNKLKKPYSQGLVGTIEDKESAIFFAHDDLNVVFAAQLNFKTKKSRFISSVSGNLNSAHLKSNHFILFDTDRRGRSPEGVVKKIKLGEKIEMLWQLRLTSPRGFKVSNSLINLDQHYAIWQSKNGTYLINKFFEDWRDNPLLIQSSYSSKLNLWN